MSIHSPETDSSNILLTQKDIKKLYQIGDEGFKKKLKLDTWKGGDDIPSQIMLLNIANCKGIILFSFFF